MSEIMDILKENLICAQCGKKLGELQFLAGTGKHRMRQNMLSHVLNYSLMFCDNDNKCAFEYYQQKFGVEMFIDHCKENNKDQ